MTASSQLLALEAPDRIGGGWVGDARHLPCSAPRGIGLRLYIDKKAAARCAATKFCVLSLASFTGSSQRAREVAACKMVSDFTRWSWHVRRSVYRQRRRTSAFCLAAEGRFARSLRLGSLRAGSQVIRAHLLWRVNDERGSARVRIGTHLARSRTRSDVHLLTRSEVAARKMVSDSARWSLQWSGEACPDNVVERVLSGLAADERLLDHCASTACVRARK